MNIEPSIRRVFQLPGLPPTWIRVYTCKKPKCDCRRAFILTSAKGPEVLTERCLNLLHQVSLDNGKTTEQLFEAANLLAFILDIDTTALYLNRSPQQMLDPTHSQIRQIAKRITGDVLDHIDSLWHQGQGLPDPEECVLAARQIVINGWEPGKLVAWNELCPTARRDVYILGNDTYEAVEQYPPDRDRKRAQVFIDFQGTARNGPPNPGSVVVEPSGAATLYPFDGRAALLEQLWTAFRARHPRYETHFSYRHDIMRAAAARFVTHV